MSRHIPAKTRSAVGKRAHFCCEYCLAFEGHSFIKFQVEHIISLKHGGKTELSNLAYSCFFCNNYKGTDLSTILEEDQLVRFYHPRKDRWTDHFQLDGYVIIPVTEIGEATLKILQINHPERLAERSALKDAGAFPHGNALLLLS